ncbi:MAG: SDR family oxidoreductase [Halobacteriaceae archaeon]
MDEQPLADAGAIVTGASSGIGAATAKRLADDGASVVVAARREERLAALVDDIEDAGGTAAAVPTDVTDEDAVAALVEATANRFGSVDVVVSNAGLAIDGAVEEMATSDYRTMMDVNVDGTFYLARAAIPHLRTSAGAFVVVGSFAGQYPRPYNPVYAATKWWVRGFAHSLAGGVGDDDVAVSVVNPSEVRTEFGEESDEAFEERFEPGEVTEPGEVADAIVFAAEQSPPTAVSELDLFRRDKFSEF